MKRLLSILTLILLVAFVFSGCSSVPTKEIKKELCGSWGYTLNTTYKFYIFSSDGTVEIVSGNANTMSVSKNYEGTYTIEKDEIVIEDDYGGTVIEYTFEDGVLSMYDNGSTALKLHKAG